MDRSDIEDDPDETEINSEEEKDGQKEEVTINTKPLNQLDFYQADPFAHCQSDRMYQTRSPSYCQASNATKYTEIPRCTELFLSSVQ